MWVKIGDQWYDSGEQPIMLVLEPCEIKHISAMSDEENRFCSYPIGADEAMIDKWMGDDGEINR